MPNTIKALTIHQPWASAIVRGLKTIETRGWCTHYRGPLLIHAAASMPKHAVSFLESLDAKTHTELTYGCDAMPCGVIVGIAILADCDAVQLLDVSQDERLWGDYSAWRYGWVLRSVRRFTNPVPYRGRQGLFNVPIEDVVEAVLYSESAHA